MKFNESKPMPVPQGQDVKLLVFINDGARQDYLGLPPDVKETADARTTMLQNGERLPQSQFTRLRGALDGVGEIRIGFDGDAFRVYYAVQMREVLYILDAGMKKSPKQSEIPKWQEERLITRLKAAVQDYLGKKDDYVRLYEERSARRPAPPNDDPSP
jgi:phage-related protein